MRKLLSSTVLLANGAAVSNVIMKSEMTNAEIRS